MRKDREVLLSRGIRPMAAFMILLSATVSGLVGNYLDGAERIVGLCFMGLFGTLWICLWIRDPQYRLVIEQGILEWYSGRGSYADHGEVHVREILEVVFERSNPSTSSNERAMMSPRVILLMRDGKRRLIPPMCVPRRSRLLDALHRENPEIKAVDRTVALFTPTDESGPIHPVGEALVADISRPFRLALACLFFVVSVAAALWGSLGIIRQGFAVVLASGAVYGLIGGVAAAGYLMRPLSFRGVMRALSGTTFGLCLVGGIGPFVPEVWEPTNSGILRWTCLLFLGAASFCGWHVYAPQAGKRGP